MEITVGNHTIHPVILFSVDSMTKQDKRERKEGEVYPGSSNKFYVPNSFYVSGMPSDTELRIKDYPDALATIHTVIANTRAQPGVTQDFRWEEQGNPGRYITLRISEAQTVVSEYSGLWTFRLFNPTYVIGDQTPQKERDLILAEAVFNLQAPTSTTLGGTIEWPGGGLNLNGRVLPGVGDEPAGFDIVGTGRRGTETDGWEYHYHGHLTRNWPHADDQRPVLVGSVFRAKSHNGDPPRSPAGSVYSFIAVRQPPFTWELAGSWTYRSFHNNPTPLYQSDSTPHHLIWEGVFKLESPTSTTLQGADEPLEGEVQRRDGTRQVVLFTSLKGTVRPDDASFRIVGTNLAGLESFYYQGHLTRNWPNAVDQRPALVGSHIRAKREGSSLPALSNPFIAVKRRT